MSESGKHSWGKAESIAAVIVAIVAVSTLAFTVATYRPTPSQSEPTPVKPADSEVDFRRQILGRWYARDESRAVPARPNGRTVISFTYDFNPSGEFIVNAKVVFSESSSSIQREVTCAGLARGRWSLSGRTLSTNFTENLMLALVGAREDSISISGALAQSRGYVCPEMPMIPAGYAITSEISEINADIMRTNESRPEGQRTNVLVYRTKE